MHSDTDQLHPLLTVREAAASLRIPERRIRRAIRERRLRAVRVGQWARLRTSDLAAWLAAHETDPDPSRPLALAGEARLRHVLRRIRGRAEAAIDGPPVDPGWLLDVVADALADEEAGQ